MTNGDSAKADIKPFSQVLRSPGDFLKLVIGRSVVVRLHSGTDYRGKKKL